MSKYSLTARQSSCNLNFKTAQKMIHKLLTQERIKTKLEEEGRIINQHESKVGLVVRMKPYTKNELSEKLDILLRR